MTRYEEEWESVALAEPGDSMDSVGTALATAIETEDDFYVILDDGDREPALDPEILPESLSDAQIAVDVLDEDDGCNGGLGFAIPVEIPRHEDWLEYDLAQEAAERSARRRRTVHLIAANLVCALLGIGLVHGLVTLLYPSPGTSPDPAAARVERAPSPVVVVAQPVDPSARRLDEFVARYEVALDLAVTRAAP